MWANFMWQAQKALHGKNNNVVLPCILVAMATFLFVYAHATDKEGGDPTKTFLGLIIVQMLPLIFLEVKILSCPDPVSMLSRFGAKVLLLHGFFLGLRVCAWPLLEVGFGWFNLLGLVFIVAALHLGFGFQLTLESFISQLDVFGLVLISAVGAFFTELMDTRTPDAEAIVFTTSSYIEIVAFVPAVWMVHQNSKKNDDFAQVSRTRTVQSQANYFFSFLLFFYFVEDLLSAYRVVSEVPVASAGHVVHFILLMDFACFLLAHIYNPDRAGGSLLTWLPGQLFV
eukprot:TRINITY_DN111582_c0_g1_i1.p1 TRINITY_DN111582_c0_g1~~TRINITY_DN111582_c0_g1_i1.p1  ORF type:complete len:284 (-),score=41.31 TRINITY_DN111582_c0_g1_i1:460-1311(-)